MGLGCKTRIRCRGCARLEEERALGFTKASEFAPGYARASEKVALRGLFKLSIVDKRVSLKQHTRCMFTLCLSVCRGPRTMLEAHECLALHSVIRRPRRLG